MPRKPRIDIPGMLYHVMARGIELKTIFEDLKDRNFFLKRMGEILIDAETPLHAFALMPNHFHLLVRRGKCPLSSVMRRLLTGYAVYFNKRHDRVGHLFQNRYKAILCQEEIYYRELVRYITLNPVWAGAVNTLADLESSGYSGHAYMLGNRQSLWFQPDEVLVHFGSDLPSARAAYRQFVSMTEQNDDPDGRTSLLSNRGVCELSYKETQMTDHRILGESGFVKKLLASDLVQESDSRKKDAQKMIDEACEMHKIQRVDLLGGAKRRPLPETRKFLA